MDPITTWLGIHLFASLAGSQALDSEERALTAPHDGWEEEFLPLQADQSLERLAFERHVTVGAEAVPWIGLERVRVALPLGLDGLHFRKEAIVLHWWEDVYTDTAGYRFPGVRRGLRIETRISTTAWLVASGDRFSWERVRTTWRGDVDAIGAISNVPVDETPDAEGQGVRLTLGCRWGWSHGANRWTPISEHALALRLEFSSVAEGRYVGLGLQGGGGVGVPLRLGR